LGSGNDANSHSEGNAHSGAIYVAQLFGDDVKWDDDDDFEFSTSLDFGDGEDDGAPRFTVVLTNNTIADNTTDRGCAGLVVKNHRPLVILKNNVFSRNTVEDGAGTCNYRQRGGHPHPAALSMGGNIFDDASGNAFLTADNDLAENSSPELGPLADNGGPTATHAIGETSSAVGNAVAGAPENDQRCLARTQPADSGAYEFGAGGGGPVNSPPIVDLPIADIVVDLGAAPVTFSVHPHFSDAEKPQITGIPEDIIVQAERRSTTAVVTWEEPTATDNVGVTSLTSNFPSGSDFPIGETVVAYIAIDAAGNTCIAAFLVTVEEPEGGFFLDFISLRTDPVPGTEGSTFNTYQRAFINENDLVAFSGSVSGGSNPGSTGVWFGDINSIEAVAVGGDAAAGAGSGVDYSLFTSVNISDADEVSFNNQMVGAVTNLTDVAHFARAGGSPLTMQAREGNAAPGTAGKFLAIHGAVAESGMTAFPAHLNIVAPITALTDTGIWSTHSGTLKLAAWEGQNVDAIPGARFGHITASMAMNESGEMAFIASLAGAGGANVAVFRGLPGAFGVAFRRDRVAPGSGGATFRLFGAAAIGGSGDVAIFGSLNNSTSLGVSSANNDGIWTNIGGTQALVAREGDQVPDLPPGVTFESFREILISANGAVCFSGFVTGPGVNSGNDGCLWSNASGSLETLMRESDLAPGTDGSQIKSIIRFSCNNNAVVGIVADMVTGIGDTTAGNTEALWLSNPETAELDLALRTGTSFEIAPGDSRTIKIITMDSSTNVPGAGGGSGRVLNDSDHLAVILDYSLGSGVFATGRIVP